LEKAVDLYDQLAKKNPDTLEHRLNGCRALLELGYLNWDDNRSSAARRWYEQALDRLEAERASAPENSEIAYELGACLVRLGGCLPEGTPNETREKHAIRAIGLFEQLLKQKYREVDSSAGLAVASYRLTMARFDGRDQQAFLNSLNALSKLEEKALALAPESPYLNLFRVFMHQDRSDALWRLGKPDEAQAERQAALAKAREIVSRSPDMHRPATILADVLYNLGRDLRRQERTADARAAFDEGIQINDGLVRRFPDRANLANLWVLRRNNLADFFEYGPKSSGEIQARQDLLRTLELTVQRGRELAARFPDHYLLQVNFAGSLVSRGRYDTEAKRDEQALPYLLEAADVYRTRVLAASNTPSSIDVTTYANQLQVAASCAGLLGKNDEIVRLSQQALEIQKQCTSRAGDDDLGRVFDEAAKLHRKAGRYSDAIKAYGQAIEVRRSALEKAPWHWYLESGLGESYKQLAETYALAKDFRNEVLTNRDYLKIIIGPRYGAQTAGFLDSSRPTDETEAKRIRELITQATASGMKRFTVPCDFDGIKYPFWVYVTNVPWPNHPLANQARWLREERGGIIPQSVMDTFARLQKVAHENNISYVDLCMSALGTPESIESIETASEGRTRGPAASGPAQGAASKDHDPIAKLRERLVAVKTKLENSPGDLATTREAAQLYQEFGQALLKAGSSQQSVEALNESVRLGELLSRAEPSSTDHRQLLAATFLSLGQAHSHLKEFDSAYKSFHRRLDLLEQLQLDGPGNEREQALAESDIQFGELAELRGDRADALRWYGLAARRRAAQGARKIAQLLQADRSLAKVLPKDHQDLLTRMEDDGVASGPNFVSDFAKEVDAAADARERLAALGTSFGLDQTGRKGWFTDFAASYHSLAEALLKQSKNKEALDALIQEINLRSLIVRLDSSDRSQMASYAQALLDAARVSIDLGKSSEGIKLVEQAQQHDAEKATIFLASLYELGKGVSRDQKKAKSLRSDVAWKKARRFFDQKEYAKAKIEFERAVAEVPSIGGYQQIGLCERRAGRNDEAIAAFKKGIELAAALNDCNQLVLDLAEAALSANRPEEVFAVMQMLEAKKWSAEQSVSPYTFERELAGMHAIALHLAGRDAAAAEKKLEEIVSRPNLASLRSRSIELDAWQKGDHPSAARQAAVKKVLEQLEAPARELTSPYFPVAKERNWVYKGQGSALIAVRASRPDARDEHKHWLLETVVNGKVTQTERIAIESDGIYRRSSNLPSLQLGLRILPLPPHGGDSWSVASVRDGSPGATGQGRTRIEDVTVPAGEYKGAIVAEVKTHDSSGEIEQTVWYATAVGPVKIVTVSKHGTTTWELEKVLTLSASFSFHKAGNMKMPTKAELLEADEDTSIVSFSHGTMADGRPYWAYIAVKPSKYREFSRRSAARETLVLRDYGEVLEAGYGKEVPAAVQQKMKEKYNLDENYAENLTKEANKAQDFFVEQREAQRIADIVEMLKKKQNH
jgi:tetratricopeptide (TPR) repeat protein